LGTDAQLELERDLWGIDLDIGPWSPEDSPWQYDDLLSSRPGLVDKFYSVKH